MKKIIAEAYTHFENYDLKEPLDICTYCCMDPKDATLLSELPVKDIPRELLSEYNDGASTEKTPVEEMKHFLPRYMELLSNFEYPSHSIEITFRRLAPFKNEEWSEIELDFLMKFARTFFKECLASYPLPENERIDSVLIMLWIGRFRLSPLLDHWKTNNSLSSVLHFKDLYFEGFNPSNPSRMSNPFGENELSGILKNWMENEEVRKAFRESIESLIMGKELVDEGQLDQLNILYEILTKPSLSR